MQTIITDTCKETLNKAFNNPFGMVYSEGMGEAVADHAKSIIAQLHAGRNRKA